MLAILSLNGEPSQLRISPNSMPPDKRYTPIIPRMAKTARDALRGLVAANLRALMRYYREKGVSDLSSPLGLERSTGLSDDTIGRFLRCERAIDVDQLVSLAAAYHVQPWELLHPSFRADAPPSATVQALVDMLADRVEADEAALAQLSGVHGKRTNQAGSDGDGNPPRAPELRKPAPKS